MKGVELNDIQNSDFDSKKVSKNYTKYESYGIYGCMKLESSTVLAVVKECKLIGYILNYPIYRIDGMRYFDISHPNFIGKQNLLSTQMMDKVVAYKSLYFSTEINLTCTMQKSLGKNNEDLQTDDRFFYNQKHTFIFEENHLQMLILPIIQGYVAVIYIIFIYIDQTLYTPKQ